MEESTSKEKILKKIRNALISKLDNPFQDVDLSASIYEKTNSSLDIVFAREFTKLNGKFVFCETITDFISNFKAVMHEYHWQNLFCADEHIQEIFRMEQIPYLSDEEDLVTMQAAITCCEYLIARLGSIMLSSGQSSGRRLHVFPETHIVLAFSSQLQPDLKEALQSMQKKYAGNLPSMISVISGPSRTADIEKTLVMGAHGPKELFLFLIDDAQ